MKEPLKEVLAKYPLKVKRITTITYKEKKGVWQVDTNQGKLILKKFPGTKERLTFILAAIEHLRAKGVLIPELVATRSGDDFADINGTPFVLNQYVAGGTPSYDSAEDLKEIMQTMGKFHKASRGFKSPHQSRERQHLGKWADTYQKHLQGLQDFKKMAAKDGSACSRLFLKHVDSFLEQGQKAMKIIQGPFYTDWVDKVDKQKNLCHQDFAGGNLIKTKKGIVVLDMDSLTYDLPARDLRKIFNKVMKKKGWSESIATRMLSAYHSLNPLSQEEYEVLHADLLFPNLFYGISSKYFQKREKEWSSSKFVEKFNMVLASEKSKQQVLSNWNRIVKNASAGKE